MPPIIASVRSESGVSFRVWNRSIITLCHIAGSKSNRNSLASMAPCHSSPLEEYPIVSPGSMPRVTASFRADDVKGIIDPLRVGDHLGLVFARLLESRGWLLTQPLGHIIRCPT